VNRSISSEEPRAAVALVRVLEPEPRLLVIRRAHNPKDPWSGHFSLPGGRREPEDADLLATSIRETFEEVGLQLALEHLIKPLPLAHAGSAIGKATPVQPFLFEIEKAPSLVLLESEVASAHWVSETFVKSPTNHVRAPMLPQWPERIFPGIPLSDYFIWGFTYGILRDYLGGFPNLDGGLHDLDEK
jgi:8-oxo-dGTP pyrophosphatase MutT (NUDIX family)